MKKPIRFFALPGTFTRAALGLVAVVVCLLAPRLAQAGWAPVISNAPDAVELMLLLPDGTIMAANAYTLAQNYGSNWYRLTPDSSGHYANGSWSTRHPASYTRLWCSTQVLQNGKVFVAGGEYGSGGNTAELYDPVADSWSIIPVPGGLICTNCSSDNANSGFRDSASVLLPNGQVMVAPVFAFTGSNTVIYDPNANALSRGPAYLASQNEAGWVKLPDSSILTVNKSSKTAERYIPALNKWIADSNAPVSLFDPFGAEEGAAFLLPNQKAFFLGGTGHTCIYTPSGTTNFGSWVTGPDITNNLACPDAGAVMMVNGKILVAACPQPTSNTEFRAPTSFFEYDYTVGATGAFTQVNSPTGGLTDNIDAYEAIMLALPDGKVLYSHFGRDLYVYTPTSGPLAAGKPTIASITMNTDNSFHATGTLFNGISQGAAYGDDAQMDTDYPLVRLTDSANHVTFARTFNWSGTTVATGSTNVTTEFDGQSILPGSYSLQVVANGIASDSVTFFGPIWVDYNYTGSTQNGQFATPFKTLDLGTNAVTSGGTIAIKAGNTNETMTIAKPMTITSVFGSSTIGK